MVLTTQSDRFREKKMKMQPPLRILFFYSSGVLPYNREKALTKR
jgi:hypothetical protein